MNETIEELKERIEELEQQLAYECGCNAELVDTQLENEKLKKAIEVFKRLYGINGEMYNYYNGGYICINNGVDITKQEYELLKEVLNNE